METKMIHMDGLHMPFPEALAGPPGSHSVRTLMGELTYPTHLSCISFVENLLEANLPTEESWNAVSLTRLVIKYLIVFFIWLQVVLLF